MSWIHPPDSKVYPKYTTSRNGMPTRPVSIPVRKCATFSASGDHPS
jgi:hypothetical protein